MASYPNKSLVIFSGIDNFRAFESDYGFRLEKILFNTGFLQRKILINFPI